MLSVDARTQTPNQRINKTMLKINDKFFLPSNEKFSNSAQLKTMGIDPKAEFTFLGLGEVTLEVSVSPTKIIKQTFLAVKTEVRNIIFYTRLWHIATTIFPEMVDLTENRPEGEIVFHTHMFCQNCNFLKQKDHFDVVEGMVAIRCKICKANSYKCLGVEELPEINFHETVKIDLADLIERFAMDKAFFQL